MRKLVTSAALLPLAAMSVPKRSLLLLFATLLAMPARAETVTIGVWDPAAYNTNAVVPYFTTGPALNTLTNQFFGTFGGNSATVAFGNPDGTTTYEFAIEDVFATTVDTARIYASWTGITSPLGQLTIPTIFQVNEGPNSGFSITEQTFICGAGTLFCDNYIVGGGTPLGAQAFPGAALGTVHADLRRPRSGLALHDHRGFPPCLQRRQPARRCRRRDLGDPDRSRPRAWTDRRCRTAGFDLRGRWSSRLVATAQKHRLQHYAPVGPRALTLQASPLTHRRSPSRPSR